ncbi:hypothetical protein GWK47_035679 [Chionoecetes opilio]|uniref:Uncharacterized protein n=1 Tax=Chionoecetes opilio TaxID=41210 RepID=A0A8J4YQ01_CHIOP|nr:hypothetical protein GWK47_035679 [Chionoecetes opilio]
MVIPEGRKKQVYGFCVKFDLPEAGAQNKSTVHRTEKELYTEEPPSGFAASSAAVFAGQNARVPCKLLMLLVRSSRLYFHPPPGFCSSPIHLVTEALEQGSSFGPNSDQPGLGSVIDLVQMPSVHVSSVHGDVHLCPASSGLILEFLNLKRAIWGPDPSSDEELQGSPSGHSTAVSLHGSIVLLMGWSIATARMHALTS